MNIETAASVLGVNVNENIDQIKKKYKKLAHVNHPDKNHDTDTTGKFQKIQKAYQIIKEFKEKGHNQGHNRGFNEEPYSNEPTVIQLRTNSQEHSRIFWNILNVFEKFGIEDIPNNSFFIFTVLLYGYQRIAVNPKKIKFFGPTFLNINEEQIKGTLKYIFDNGQLNNYKFYKCCDCKKQARDLKTAFAKLYPSENDIPYFETINIGELVCFPCDLKRSSMVRKRFLFILVYKKINKIKSFFKKIKKKYGRK